MAEHDASALNLLGETDDGLGLHAEFNML